MPATEVASGLLSWASDIEQDTVEQARARALLDEHPASYKDIDQVMAAQTDLVHVQHMLHQVLNYKGV